MSETTKLQKVIARAIRMGAVKDGLVMCENSDLCGNPASASLSTAVGWTACAPCVWGEADSFDASDLIPVEQKAVKSK